MAASWRHGDDPPRPNAVGILALEVYFPMQKVSMTDMEAADGCPGKYTVGLGQEEMAFCSDREDAVSLALTVAHSLLEKYDVGPREVGHLQVATESGVDRSKSIKSHLMQLFQQKQNQQQQEGREEEGDGEEHRTQQQRGPQQQRGRRYGSGPPAEGSDCIHACFGSTAALLAAAAWVESRRWNGRLALVVAADVALYAPGTAARPTGGCGAAAFLVGPNAPLVLDPLWYGTHSEHSWDFHKPLGTLPYPVVDGPLTLAQYLGAAGSCAMGLADRLAGAGELPPGAGLLPLVAHYVAHAPFAKLARKGLMRVALMDELRAAEGAGTPGEAAAGGGGGGDQQAQRGSGEGLGEGLLPGQEEAVDAGAGPMGDFEEGLRKGGEGPPQSAQPQEWVQEWMQQQQADGRGPQEVEAAPGGTQEVEAAPGGTQEVEAAPGGAQEVEAAPGGPWIGGSTAAARADAGAAASPLPGPPGGHASGRGPTAPCGGASSSLIVSSPSLVPPATTALQAGACSPSVTSASTAAAAAGAITAQAAAGAAGSSCPDSRPSGPDGARILSLAEQLPESYESYPTWRLNDKALEAQLLGATAALCHEKADDAAWLQKRVGNSYTACVWQGLASLVWRQGPGLAGRRVLLFSFGSGTIASLLSLVARGPGTHAVGCAGAIPRAAVQGGRTAASAPGRGGCEEGGVHSMGTVGGNGVGGADSGPSDPRFTLEAMRRALDLDGRLCARVQRPLSCFDAVSSQVAASYTCPVPYAPDGDLADVAAGSYYLVRVDEHSRRWYERKA